MIDGIHKMVVETLANGKLSKRINLKLQDLNDHFLDVTLWDAYAEQMATFQAKNADRAGVVIILQFAKVKTYGDSISVSNCYEVARLFIDEDIDDVASFKKSWSSKPLSETSSSLRGIGSFISGSLDDEFLKDHPFTFISDVSLITEITKVIILATVVGVKADMEWYYTGCKKCNCKVFPKVILNETGDVEEKKVYECQSEICKDQEITAVPRYKIPIKVMDITGTMSLTMFEREAYKVIKKACYDLVESILDGKAELFPLELNALKDKKFAFMISVRQYNLKNKNDLYSITKMTEDPEILAALEKKFDVGQVTETISVENEVTSSVGKKISISCVGDNVTPISSAGKGHTLEMDEDNEVSPSNSLKRNLGYVYDDDSACQSSSKIRGGVDKDQDNNNEKEKLLIPKVEK
ncbi:putative nucleic acid-binding, replication factor A [Helianthus anomalus]